MLRARRTASLLAIVVVALAAASSSSARSPLALAGVATPVSQQVARAVPDCKRGYYKNVSGRCVRRPSNDPAGATAKCKDGTYSYSEHASGTCSHHGGVARWTHHP